MGVMESTSREAATDATMSAIEFAGEAARASFFAIFWADLTTFFRVSVAPEATREVITRWAATGVAAKKVAKIITTEVINSAKKRIVLIFFSNFARYIAIKWP